MLVDTHTHFYDEWLTRSTDALDLVQNSRFLSKKFLSL